MATPGVRCRNQASDLKGTSVPLNMAPGVAGPTILIGEEQTIGKRLENHSVSLRWIPGLWIGQPDLDRSANFSYFFQKQSIWIYNHQSNSRGGFSALSVTARGKWIRYWLKRSGV